MSFINQGKAGFIFGNVFVRGAKTGRPAFKDMSQTRGYPGWVEPEAPELPIVFHAATYDPITFELQQELVGVGGETCTHTSTIYAPDHDGVYRAFGANEPVWEGARATQTIKMNQKGLANWTLGADITRTSGQTDPDGGSNAFRITANVSGTTLNNYLRAWTATSNTTDHAVCSIWIKRVTGEGPVELLGFSNLNSGPDITAQLTTEWQRFSHFDAVGVHLYTGVGVYVAGDEIDIAFNMEENTTNTVPSEYFDSVGEEVTGPSYAHENPNTVTDNVVTDTGAGTLLDPLPMLKYQGAATNIMAQSNTFATWYIQGVATLTQNLVGLDGSTSGWTFTAEAGTSRVYTSIGSVPTAGASIITARYWLHKNMATSVQVETEINGGAALSPIINVDTTDGTFTGEIAGTRVKVVDEGLFWKVMVEVECVGITGFNARYFANKTQDYGFTQHEVYRDLTLEQVEPLGPISTTTDAVSTDEILYSWSAANHSDAGDSYEADYKLSGGDQVLLSMGGTAVLSVVSGDVVLSDGTNSCSTPVVSSEAHIKATYNATDGLTLDVDGVTATSAYDGTLGSGDLSTKATQRDLIRRGS